VFGSNDYPAGKAVLVNLLSLTRIGSAIGPTQAHEFKTAILDSSRGESYFVSYSNPSYLVSFTLNSSYTPDPPTTTTTAASSNSQSGKSSSLSPTQTAGVAVGSSIGFVAIVVLAVVLIVKIRRGKKSLKPDDIIEDEDDTITTNEPTPQYKTENKEELKEVVNGV
jgi:hypothetical protein